MASPEELGLASFIGIHVRASVCREAWSSEFVAYFGLRSPLRSYGLSLCTPCVCLLDSPVG